MSLVVDATQRRVYLDEKEVILTRTELGIISLLSSVVGRIFSPDEILAQVWGEGYVGQYRLLYVFISRLRRKLPNIILSRSGIGYFVEGNEVSGNTLGR